jgi:hypothetical protein
MTKMTNAEQPPGEDRTTRLGEPLTDRAYTWDDFPHPLRAHDVLPLIAKDIA